MQDILGILIWITFVCGILSFLVWRFGPKEWRKVTTHTTDLSVISIILLFTIYRLIYGPWWLVILWVGVGIYILRDPLKRVTRRRDAVQLDSRSDHP